MKKSVISGAGYFVMEVSSHAIDQNRIEAIQFALKVLTNVTQDHLDYHKTIAE
jgi:UDP-N-acetylmuramoyl-L-alanyl-D-glutamate--2,6-diaminopimelate ligase